MSTHKRHWSTVFYWLGIALAAACFGTILAGNTDLFWQFEHAAFPLSWALAGIAVVAFLLYELFSSAAPRPEREERSLAARWEPEF